MMTVVAFDGVTSFSCVKTLQKYVNVCDTVQLLAGFPQCNGESWKKLKTSNVFWSFIVC